jgi:hypothetical protein
MVMKLWVPLNAGNLLTTWGTVGFSRRTLPIEIVSQSVKILSSLHQPVCVWSKCIMNRWIVHHKTQTVAFHGFYTKCLWNEVHLTKHCDERKAWVANLCKSLFQNSRQKSCVHVNTNICTHKYYVMILVTVLLSERMAIAQSV